MFDLTDPAALLRVPRATYRLQLGSADTGGQRATRVLWQRS